MPTEIRATTPVTDEVCVECDTHLEDRVGEACPECDHYRCPHLESSDSDPCGATFESHRGMAQHYTRTHDSTYHEYADCNHCGERFPKDQPDQMFCSLDCSTARRRHRIEKPCPECGDTFESLPSDGQTYCSQECTNRARRTRETRTCPECGDEFEAYPSRPKTFCSRACFNKHGMNGPPERTCQHCGDDFASYQKQKYCSRACVDKARSDGVI